VEPEAGQIHIFRFCRRIQPTKNETQPVGMGGLNPGLGAGFEKSPQSLVAK
jgi:hypothetical protein